MMEKYKEDLVKFLNIERDSKRPRKDITTFKDLKNESFYIIDEFFLNNYNITYKNYSSDKKLDINLLSKYADYYDVSDSYEEWFNKIKLFAKENNYAEEVKLYKADSSKYLGHVGDICEMIRFVVTGRYQTPDLYYILQILGNNRVKERIKFYKDNIK